MFNSSPWPRSLLAIFAVVFAAVMTAYSGIWMFTTRRAPRTVLGLEYVFHFTTASLHVIRVFEGGSAARAGVLPGDEIVAINGEHLETLTPLWEALFGGRPGDNALLSVRREGRPDILSLAVNLSSRPPPAARPLSRRVAGEMLNSYPALFLVVAVAVLLLRVDDRNAWLLALLFACFIAAAPYFDAQVPRALRGFAVAYKIAFDGISAGVFLFFFSVFPEPSPLDRRLPWLKWVWLGSGVLVALPLAAWAFAAGGPDPLLAAFRDRGHAVHILLLANFFGGFGLGLVSLLLNALRGTSGGRRKSRVILWGTLLGFGPVFCLSAAGAYAGKAPYEFPFWVWAPSIIAMFLIPLSFAYAVVKHRVVEIPVLLRRSARYVLVHRGFLFLLLLIGTADTLFFARSFAAYLGPGAEAMAIGLGTAFGAALVWMLTRVQRRVRERIDRAFFRGAYDARHVLEELAEKARQATTREDLAALLELEHHLRAALYPASLRVYLDAPPDLLRLCRGEAPADCRVFETSDSALVELARHAKPLVLEPPAGISLLAPLDPDCLVPIIDRGGHLIGLLALGPRLSEESYSGEDKRLLASVASQAGVALESIRMAEQMAERLDAERRAEHEMELAKQVQRRLLPQEPPALATATCAGRCVQARAVGGDYYDFLDLGAGRVGLVLADVCGKGFPAALLMASLQASLRSQLAHDTIDLPRQLRSVHQLLYRTSETNRYATLFLGIYHDDSRRLHYANCGHNPPLILRAGGSVERLLPTAPALGLFEEWHGGTAEARLDPGDLLVLFSDGITEAFSDDGLEFGEARLIEALRTPRALRMTELVDVVLMAVMRFSGSEQEDDQTLVVLRGQ